ncbi:type II toxin-antitoxin system VapC family toxin [Pelagicoccus albus]|uniref:Ribonuclease VapC n=1 Tax=Pelagicoccus albus TaxID=415222 RepID=A0A7X1E6N4_9BACT|nr:type II toxin-antitoxin system VapC family toxin [Pelagicoccus albus]MBC2604444.1 type II toxin-antitoxin system VapC family toxin [Pelagicoccus albus]
MLFDTDIFIWIQRGNAKAARLVDRTKSNERFLSIQTYMELMQCAQNRNQLKLTKSFLADLGFVTLPLTENIGHRASVYVEQFSLSHAVRAGDALIASTAVENNLTLVSSNAKHFKTIPDLDYKKFTP